MGYIYYDYDNALYRKPVEDAAYPHITQIKTPHGWKTYEGDDPIAPVFYGDRITPEQAGEKE